MPGETFSSNDTYVINHGSDGPQDTKHTWWKDTNDQCVANAYIDLGLESDSFNAEPTTYPWTDDKEVRRSFIPPDVRLNNCYPADHAFKANINWEKPTSLPFTFTSNVKAGFSRYKAVYRLVSGFGPT